MTDHTNRDLSDRPAWARDAVFYQIFPDRFARSERVPKPANLLSWHTPPSLQGYHGGDLLGIAEHLDYLVELGINAIYLNPIFQSACNHRYHTHDYQNVDPLLGGNSAFRELVQAAHSRNIRIILDGVFNHASRGFFQFNDILENGPHSPWLDWFHLQGWPLAPYDGRRPANYVGWTGNRALPKFNTDNPQVREFLMGIAEFWIREYDIDGWRLDVPAEITTTGFWEEFRCRVRAIKADAYLVGEVWRGSTEWLRGDRFDATMNYGFSAATIAFTAGERVSCTLVEDRDYDAYPGIDAIEFAGRIRQLLAVHDWETTLVQFNLLDSHDTPRVLSIARGDKATLRLATLFQMTYPGTPCVYYGDEIALRGTKRYSRPHRDQDARWPFPWHDDSIWDRDMLQYFRQVIALRHAHPALRHGKFEEVYAEAQQYAFVRHDSSETLLVILNAGDEPAEINVPISRHVSDGELLTPLLGTAVECTARDGLLGLTLPPRAGGAFCTPWTVTLDDLPGHGVAPRKPPHLVECDSMVDRFVDLAELIGPDSTTAACHFEERNGMSIVQQDESLMDRLTPKDRMARSVAMLKWSRDLIARQILATRGPRSFERLKWEVALRQYGSDPEVRAMIEKMLERVSN